MGGREVGRIGAGLCVLVGVTHDDDADVAVRAARKVCQLRVFDDGTGTMNTSLLDTGGEVLVVSQFTLYGDTTRGRRPSWAGAAPPAHALPVLAAFEAELRANGITVASGEFGASMQVELVNDGPVTLMVEVTRTP